MDKYNVVLINCDDLGYGDLGCYGSKVNSTPIIDKLAKEGVKCTSFYASSPVCSPSRASLMTGCLPPRVGINKVLFPSSHLGLSNDTYTMPQMFKENGYSTCIVGKWHLGDQKEFLPTKFGFDDYYGLPYSNDMGKSVGNEDDVRFPPLPLISGEVVVEEQPDQKSLTERYTEKCTTFIRKNKDNPFFLYFAQMHVHLPLYAADRFERESKNGDFGACMSELDWSVHCIIYELKKHNIYDNTIIIFTSDNGSRADHGASNGLLKGCKQQTWEGGQRVPFIIVNKNLFPSEREVDMIGSQVDLLPTLANFINAKLPDDLDIDGIDISNMLTRGEKVRSIFIYYGQDNEDNFQHLCAVRYDKWKLHVERLKIPEFEYEIVNELYDLDLDKGETNNIFDLYPDVVAHITQIIEQYKKILGDKKSSEKGNSCRKSGWCKNPKFLTHYDPNHPYIIALYDKNDMG